MNPEPRGEAALDQASGSSGRQVPSSREAWIGAALAIFAALRVFAFDSAFPFFNGIDEHLHFDLVQKYARGFLPGAELATFDATSARLILDHASPEYAKGPEDYREELVPTPQQVRARRPAGSPNDQLAFRNLIERKNMEADSPPVFYALAGAWLRLGRLLGQGGLASLYWIRWLNVVITGALVALTYAFLARRHPEDPFRRLGPPAFLACWPNDLLYGITPDVLSAGLGGLCFFGLVRLREARRGVLAHALVGLALGLAFLTKYTNLVFAVVAGALFADVLRRGLRAREAREDVLRWLALWAAAGIPAAWWLCRNERVIGGLSGQSRKLAVLGWTAHSPAEILAHPFFRLRGWLDFSSTLVGSFWRGEFLWHGELQHFAAVDVIYLVTTPAFLALAAWGWLRRVRQPAAARRIEAVALAVTSLSVLLLAVLSTLFDFGHDEGTLSRAFPYLASGRLIAGVVLPFAVLYCRGAALLWAWAPSRVASLGSWLTLVAVLVVACASEVATSASAFASSWNWFHLG